VGLLVVLVVELFLVVEVEMVVVDAEVEIGVVDVLAVGVVSFDKELLVTAVSFDVELDAKMILNDHFRRGVG
jgi:hypothetical protein